MESTYELLAVGTDTEVFWKDAKTGQAVPCIGLVGGTKEDPKLIFNSKQGYAVQEDNVMAEFNVPPATNAQTFSDSIGRVLEYLGKEAAKNGCQLQITPSAKFTPEQLEHPQAKAIGCMPDYCVWTRAVNEFDEAKRKILDYLRTSGGHIHASFKNKGKDKPLSMEDREIVTMSFDLHLGVPGIMYERGDERKLLYGRAGAFRPKDYGIEWRVFSNWWVKEDVYRRWVFNQAKLAVENAGRKNYVRCMLDRGQNIIDAINNSDVELMKALMRDFNIEGPIA